MTALTSLACLAVHQAVAFSGNLTATTRSNVTVRMRNNPFICRELINQTRIRQSMSRSGCESNKHTSRTPFRCTIPTWLTQRAGRSKYRIRVFGCCVETSHTLIWCSNNTYTCSYGQRIDAESNCDFVCCIVKLFCSERFVCIGWQLYTCVLFVSVISPFALLSVLATRVSVVLLLLSLSSGVRLAMVNVIVSSSFLSSPHVSLTAFSVNSNSI